MISIYGYIALLEVTFYCLVVGAFTYLALVQLVGLYFCVWGATVLLIILLIMAWRHFHYGRHPVFLFMVMLLIFQAGRLVAYVFGATSNPMRIVVQAPYPIGVDAQSAEIALLLISISAICVYIPCSLFYRVSIMRVRRRPEWIAALYVVIAITYPISIYKSVAYLAYVRSHGGYIEIFTNNAKVLSQAGDVVRFVALLAPIALIVAYIFETSQRIERLVILLYLLLAVLDLLIGMRGKVFSEIVTLWFLHNIKMNKQFYLAGMTVTALVGSILASWIASYRQNQLIGIVSPLRFMAVQGVSMNVTEMAVAYRHLFSRFSMEYLLNGFWNGIRPITTLQQGHLWTIDLSMFLNPVSTRLGFGTASSYLAELYLFGGMIAVVAGSFLIGLIFVKLHQVSSHPWGAVAVGLLLPTLIYLPRLEVLNPLASALKNGLGLVIVMSLTFSCEWVNKVILWIIRESRLESQNAR